MLRAMTRLLLALLLLPAPASAQIALDPWEPLFEGVEIARGERVEPLQRAVALRVALDREGVEILGTPGNGDAPLELDSSTTSQFVAASGASAAINGGFYSPCCIFGRDSEPKDVLGLVVTEGEIVSPPEADGSFAPTLLVDTEGAARIASVDASTDLSGVWTAVAGNVFLLADGENVGADGERHPRTAVGLSEDRRTLFWLALDGRQSEWSLGSTDRETAQWMAALGAHDAINLDGGGSTTMVVARPGMRPEVVNRPVIAATERSNANHLGLRARALPRPDAGPAATDAGPEPVEASSGCAVGAGPTPAVIPIGVAFVVCALRYRRRP